MADTATFFNETLPQKLTDDPDLKEIDAVFQFDVDGAGTWSLDLKGDGGVTEGPHDSPDCVITVAKDDWEQVVDNPSVATNLFMMGKLKATNLGLAMQLQKILS